MIEGIGGKCLDARALGTANGTLPQLGDCNGGANQRFSVRGSTQGIGGKCLNALGTQANPESWHGNGVQMWTCRGTPNQVWTYAP
jgi:alpha-galactosidase